MLPVLATQADATAYGYPVIADTWYVRASARVRRFLGQDITESTSTTTLPGSGPWLLPQRPVSAVSSVQDRNSNPIAFELEGSWLCADSRLGPLTVTYTHGHNPVPDGLIELVCAIAARMSSVPDAVASGARTEQAGAEAVTWGVEAYNAASGLTAGEEEGLRQFYPKLPRTIVMRAAPLRWRP